jgi:hypothetical protein
VRDPLTVNDIRNFGTVQVGAVPEPSTWAMMILGFLGIDLLTYRRKDMALMIVHPRTVRPER